jgi:hypothetical protein
MSVTELRVICATAGTRRKPTRLPRRLILPDWSHPRNNGITRQAITHKRSPEARSRNHCCHGRAINIIYFECVSVVLDMQHVKRMRRIILPSVACLAVPYSSTLSHKQYDFREIFIEHKMCVLILSTTFF